MKLKTLTGDEIVKELLRVCPFAQVTLRGGNLHELRINDVRIIIASYSIEVVKEERPVVHIATAVVGGCEIRLQAEKKDALEDKVSKFNSSLAEPVEFSYHEETINTPPAQ